MNEWLAAIRLKQLTYIYFVGFGNRRQGTENAGGSVCEEKRPNDAKNGRDGSESIDVHVISIDAQPQRSAARLCRGGCIA